MPRIIGTSTNTSVMIASDSMEKREMARTAKKMISLSFILRPFNVLRKRFCETRLVRPSAGALDKTVSIA